MYQQFRGKIPADFHESYPYLWIIGENIFYLSTWILAGLILWPLQWNGWPIAVIFWCAIVIIIQVLLKKHNCSGCYYYGKKCHLGWGKLSACMFGQDSGNPKTALRLSLFYILSPPIILLTGILSGIFLDVNTWHWIFLGVFIALNGISFPLRKKGCSLCAMRIACPGSAVKQKG
jgi:hypothetical protein